jgi:hypothetical protein
MPLEFLPMRLPSLCVAICSILFAALTLIGPAASTASAACTVDAKLVNSCRPWLGAYANGYPQVASGLRSQTEYHEQRIGRKGDFVRGNYKTGYQALSADEKYFISRSNTHVLINWKPTAGTWKSAAGGNSSVNADIDKMADQFKSVAPAKILLTVYHEPENDVSPGTGACFSTSGGTKGSTTDYINMWHNVRKRFDAKGVNNVVWAINWMGWSSADCLMKQMWPGNSYVDWILVDPYGSAGHPNADTSAGRVYRVLENQSDSSHDFTSKPWGVAEFSVHEVAQSTAYSYWDSWKTAMANGAYPRYKLYMPFDNNAGAGGMPATTGNQVAYGQGSNPPFDQTEQNHYNGFAQSSRFKDPVATGDTTDPSLTITAPAAGANVTQGTVIVTATASDNVGVANTTLSVDGTQRGSDATAPYSFSWDAQEVGQHTLSVKAVDAAGNATTKSVVVDVVAAAEDTTRPTVNITSPKGGAKITTTKFTVTASASDNVGLQELRLLINGTVYSVDKAASWSFSVPRSELVSGANTIRINAFDTSWNMGSDTITVYK